MFPAVDAQGVRQGIWICFFVGDKLELANAECLFDSVANRVIGCEYLHPDLVERLLTAAVWRPEKRPGQITLKMDLIVPFYN